MDKVLTPMLGRNVQAYVDDMVVTSRDRRRHTTDLEELFATISKYRLKLNPEKCVFGVEAGKFLGFLLTERGIEANPDKCSHHRYEKPNIGEGSATTDRANDSVIKVRFCRRGEGTPLFPVPQKK